MALSFTVKMADEVSPAATKAASNLQRLDAAIKNESRALSVLESQMKAMARSGSVSIDVGRKLNASIDAQKGKIAGLTEQMLRSGGAGFAPASAKASALDGVLGQLTQQSSKAGQALAALGPYGAIAATAIAAIGLAALATAGTIAYLASKLISLGVAAGEAKGDTTRSLELLYGSEKAALHTYRVLESLTADIAISHGRVMELSDTLIKAGQVNGDAMVRSIAAIGKAEAARAGAGKVLEGVIVRSQQARVFSISRSELMQVGLSYKALAQEISKGTGMTVTEATLRLRTGGVRLKEGLDALARVVDSKMGDLANKKFMTVGVQAQRLKDSFSRLFENVNTGPLARMLQVMANLLDDSKTSGHALRTVLTQAFGEIARAVEAATPVAELFFKGAILLALKLYNALYPVRQSLARIFGGNQAAGLDSLENSILSFATGVEVAFTAAAGALAFMINNAAKLAKTIEILAGAAPIVGPAFQAAAATIKSLTAAMAAGSPETNKSGQSVAEGVAVGIRQGTPAVEKAMGDMAAKGVKAFDDKMQIKSPSRLMQIRGRYTDEGFAKGVNDNAEGPAEAMRQVAIKTADAPAQVAPGLRASRGGGGGEVGGAGGILVQFNAGAIQGYTPGQTSQIRDEMSELMADVFEKANRLRAGGER